MQAPEIAALTPDTPIVFPLAAIEQHGQHLPVPAQRDGGAEVGPRILTRPPDGAVPLHPLVRLVILCMCARGQSGGCH